MIYRQKIGIGFSTQSPSRLSMLDQQDNMAKSGLSLFPGPLVHLVYYQQDGMAMFRRFLFLLETKIRFDISIGTIRPRLESAGEHHFALPLPVFSKWNQLRDKHIKEQLVPPMGKQLRCELII